MIRPTFSRPLVPLALFMGAGIIAGLKVPDDAMFFSAAIVLVFLFGILVWRVPKIDWLLLVLFFLFGYQRFQSALDPPNLEPSRKPISHWIDDGRWHLSGNIDSLVKRYPDRTLFVMKAESLSRGQMTHPVTGRVRVTIRKRADGIHEGDRITFSAKLRQIRNFNNPGGFDYKRTMLFQNVIASVSVSRKTPVMKLGTTQSNLFWRTVLRCRQAVFGLIEKTVPGTSRGLAKALIMGDRSEIPIETGNVFSRIGISHLLAISGLHMGMVATIAFFFFRMLLSLSEKLLTGGWSTRGAAVACIVPVLVYGLLAGRTPATERAMVMVILFLLAIVLGKENDAMNTLAAAALVILIVTPSALFAISFQLSFSAVLAIFYVQQRGYAVFCSGRSRLAFLLKKPAQFLAVSLAAILGTLPLTLFYFNQMSWIGLLANCIMVPLVGFGAVPMGVLAVFLLPMTESGALWVIERTMQVLDACSALAESLGCVSFVSTRTVTPTLLEIFLYYGALWSILNLRKVRVARLLLLAVVFVGIADGAYWLHRRFLHNDLRITFLDVGQGNAALIDLPGGQCMLVDGGGFFDNRFDVGERIVAPFLWSQKIGRVETLVLSHPHPDHLNGLLFIARNFDVQEVWMNGASVRSPVFEQFEQTLVDGGIKKITLDAMAQPRTIGGVRFDVLYPPKNFLAQKNQKHWCTINNNSLVLKATKGSISFLFPGDIEKEAESELVAIAGDRLKCQVLLAPHHGSKTSSTMAFLRNVDPRIVVFSAGWKNIFRFPHTEVLRRYEKQGCSIFRTDRHGAVTVVTDGEEVDVMPFVDDGRNCE